MTRTEAIKLYQYLAVTFPRQYGGLSDEELPIVVDNLAWAYRFNTYDEVLIEYRKAYALSKVAPHPSEILKELKPTNVGVIKTSLDPDAVYARLKELPEYRQLVKSFGNDNKAERKVRRAAKLCTQTGTFNELLFHLEYDD